MVARSHISFLGPGRVVELPRPARSAAPLAALAIFAAAIAVLPDVPRTAALVAATALALAAAIRAWQKRHALAQLRATADRVLLRGVSIPLSPLLAWRVGELMRVERRERLAASIARIERSARESYMPGAVPLNRRAVRSHKAELDAIADRLLVPEPVSPLGVLLVQRLLDDPAGPLYEVERAPELAADLERALRALDDPAWYVSR